MKIPTIHGLIARRILINYTTDPEVVTKILPFTFGPQIYKGKAISVIFDNALLMRNILHEWRIADKKPTGKKALQKHPI